MSILSCISANDIKTAKTLLETYPDLIHEMTCVGAEPLQVSAHEGLTHFVRLLLDHKANVNHRNMHGISALNSAVASGNIETVKLLIAAGARLTVKDNYGYTALGEARKAHNYEIEDYLLALGAE